MVELEIISYIQKKRGYKTRPSIYEIVKAQLYKLLTRVQWKYSLVEDLFIDIELHYKIVFGHYSKWRNDDIWESLWIQLLKYNKILLTLLRSDLDSCHTVALKVGEKVDGQEKKKRKTIDALYLIVRQGFPIVVSEFNLGNHNYLFGNEVYFNKIIRTIEPTDISANGLYINVNAGFDSRKLQNLYKEKDIITIIKFSSGNDLNDEKDYFFDEKLYKERYYVERASAWMGDFMDLLNRFYTIIINWESLIFLTFFSLKNLNLHVKMTPYKIK